MAQPPPGTVEHPRHVFAELREQFGAARLDFQFAEEIEYQGAGAPDFSLTNVLVNLPHIVLAGIALAFGFGKSPSRVRSAA